MSVSVSDLAEVERGFLTGSDLARAAARRLLLRRLERLERGRLRLVEADGVRSFGTAGDGPAVELRVTDPRFYAKVAFGGSIGAAESYMAGQWRTDDLTGLLRLILRNRSVLEGLESGWARLVAPFRRLFHLLRDNTRRGSRRNIEAHYDLGNEFFALFLDRRRMYSCAVFDPPGATLDQAQEAKLERICRKLDLQPGDRVLEIGTGWGGFALHAAGRHGCRVTTATISPAQHRHATEAVREAGLDHRVEVLLRDYRELEGRYDKLVSIEMIEAVGHRHLGRFFELCCRRLAPHGLMLLQSITLADPLYRRYRQSVDFIQRYIFPGGALPSVGALTAAVAERTDLVAVHLEDLGSHYARTLRHWRERFHAHRDRVAAMGFSERFCRMWEYYFCYCEAGFLERTVSDVQLLLARPENRRAPVLGALT
jgi:cyclopropane-fatty-acyl-phospholipid synthase